MRSWIAPLCAVMLFACHAPQSATRGALTRTNLGARRTTWNVTGVADFAVDDDAIFAIIGVPRGDSLVRIDRATGEQDKLASLTETDQPGSPTLRASGDSLYVLDVDDKRWRLLAIPKSGGAARVITGSELDRASVPTFAVDADAAYLELQGRASSASTWHFQLERVSLRTGAGQTIATDLASDRTACCERVELAGPDVVFGYGVMVAGAASGTLVAIDRAFRSKPRELPHLTDNDGDDAGACSTWDTPALDDESVFSGYGSDHAKIVRTDIASGKTTTIFDGALGGCVKDLTVLDGTLYWSVVQRDLENGNDKLLEVRAMPVRGGAWTKVSAIPSGFTRDGERWWSDGKGIHRAAVSRVVRRTR
jgi:hypothetical protein